MSYAIMRIAKIKAKSSFAAIERHHQERDRLKHRKNASRAQENRQLQNIYHSPEKSLTERFTALTEGMSYRKDSVLGFEIVLAYSPEAAKDIERNQSEWIAANLAWVSQSFGGAVNVIGAYFHADESTPHMHAIVVPIVRDKDKRPVKLSAYHYVHGKLSLSQLQDSYAQSMQRFGLDRGNRYVDCPEIPSRRHETLQHYWYSVDEKTRSEAEKIKAEIFGPDDRQNR